MAEKLDFSDLVNTPHEKIKQLMGEQGLSIEELALKIEMEPEILENILTYTRGRIFGSMLDKLAVAFGVTRETLLEGQIRWEK